MSSKAFDACLLVLALSLAACTGAPDGGAGDAEPALAGHEDPALDTPAEDVPPATVPGAAAALGPLAADFSGLGPVPFGADARALRMAWNGPLEGGPDAKDPLACYYLFPQPRPAHGYGSGFMVEGGRFVRVDVDDPAVTAPGGGRIGMPASEIEGLYPGDIEEQPHKYVDGARYLRVSRQGSPAVLLFETDASGQVQEWRIGVPPQVDYVEGCS